MILRNPDAEPGESRSSYAMRLAHANRLATFRVGMAEIRAILQNYEGEPLAWREEESPAGISAEACDDHREAEANRRASGGIGERFLRCQHRSFCHLCLADGHYWRTDWEYVFVSFCPIHRVWLEDRCSCCNGHVPFWSVPPYCGSCGARVGSVGQGELVADPGSEYLAEILVRCVQDGAWAPDLLDYAVPWQIKQGHLSYEQLSRIVLLIGSYSAGREGKPRKVPLQSDCRVVRALISHAAHSLMPWPRAFHALLGRIIDPARSTFSGKMSNLYRAIYREFSEGEVEFLRLEIESYLAANWDGVLSRRHRNFSAELLGNQRMASVEQARADSGITRRALINGIREGRVEGKLEYLPSGRIRAAVRMDLFDPQDPELHFLTLKDAAVELGLPEQRVRELISAGVLVGRAPQGGSPWAISLGQVSALAEGIRRHARLETTGKGHSLSHLARYTPAVAHAFPAFITAVLAGEVAVRCSDLEDKPAVGCVLVEIRAVRRWQLGREGFLSIPHAAELLGLKQEVAYHLYRRGLIATSATASPCPALTPEDIRTFQARYVLATELAEAAGRSPKALVADMTAKGMVPASGPGVDGGRQVVYERRVVSGLSWFERGAK